jgi:hypothetical protein
MFRFGHEPHQQFINNSLGRDFSSTSTNDVATLWQVLLEHMPQGDVKWTTLIARRIATTPVTGEIG